MMLKQLETHLGELLGRVGDPGSPTAEDVGRADDDRQSDLGDDLLGFVHRVRDPTARHLEADLDHRLLEPLPVLGGGDGLGIGPDQLHPVAVEHAGLHQLHRQVQRRLATERRQEGIRSLRLDDGGEDLGRERLDVGRIGEVGVGHDRGRIRVGQDHPVTVGAQRPTRLGARVVEFAGLTDDDRARPDQEDAVDVVSSPHPQTPAISSSNWSNK